MGRYTNGEIFRIYGEPIHDLLKSNPNYSARIIYETLGADCKFNTFRRLVGELRNQIGLHWPQGSVRIKNEKIEDSKRADFSPIFEEELSPNIIFDGFEEGEFTPRPPYIIKAPAKILLLNDVHIPYHDRNAVLSALSYGREQNVDLIYLNGDIVDFYAVSRWSKNPDKQLLKKEVQMSHNFFAGLRKMFPKARIVFKSGNHENRFERYIIDVAPALFGMEGFDIPSILKLNDYGIDYVDDKTITIAGELNILHGHEVKFGGINVARSMYLKSSANVIFGHFHVSQEYTQRTLQGKLHGCWAIGCLCDLKPDYHAINNWNHGFAIINVNKDGSFEVESKKIMSGKIV